MSHPYLLDAETVAPAMNVSVSSVYAMSRNGTLPFPAMKLGKLWRYKRTDVEEFLGTTLENALNAELVES